MNAIEFLKREHVQGFGFPVTDEGYVQLCFVGLCNGKPLLNQAGLIQYKLVEAAPSVRLTYLRAEQHRDLVHKKGKWVVEISISEWSLIPQVMNRLLSCFPPETVWVTMLSHSLHARFVSHGRLKPGKHQEWSWEAVEHRVAVDFYASVFGGRCCQRTAHEHKLLEDQGNLDQVLKDMVVHAFKKRGSPSVWLCERNWLTEVGRGLCRFVRTHWGSFLEDRSLTQSRKLKTQYDIECRKYKVLRHGGWPCA